MRSQKSIALVAALPSLLILGLAVLAIAGPVDTPNTFTPNTVANANEVNENFAALEGAIDDNDARIAVNETALTSHQTTLDQHTAALAAHDTRLATNEAHIAANTADIGTNATDIATNASGISGHETRISAIENGSPVTGLDADLLDGFHATDLVRASYAEATSGVDNWSSNSYATFVTKTVTVPTSGILLIWGKTEASWDIDSSASTYAWLQTRITVGGSEVGTTGTVEFFDNLIGLDLKIVPVSVAVPVSAGSVTVNLEGRVYSGSAYLYLGYRSLMTLFVPFGNSGNQGSLAFVGASTNGSGEEATPPMPPPPDR